MANNKINELVHRAQLKGVLLVEDSKGNWRAEYNHGGELWTLDSAQPEDVLDDMDALIETLTQDDLYAADYNEDLGKYLVSVNGVEKPFVADTLREAFAMAKASVLAKAKPAETARRKFGKRAEPEPVEEVHAEPEKAEAVDAVKARDEAIAEAQAKAKAEAQAKAAQKPTSPPVGVQPPGQGRREADLLPPVLTGALVNLIEAIANLVTLVAAQVPVAAVSNKPNGGANVKSDEVEEFNEPAEPTTTAPPRRRAAAKRT